MNTGAKIAVGILAAAALMPFPGTGAAIAAVLPRTKKSKGRQRFNKAVRMVRRQMKERADKTTNNMKVFDLSKKGSEEKFLVELRDQVTRSRSQPSN